jgi:hypothetical protein
VGGQISRVVAPAALLVAACGGDGAGDEASQVDRFCHQFAEFRLTPVYAAALDPQAYAAGRDPTASGFQEAVEKLKAIEPPDELAEDWAVVEVEYEAPSVVDPGSPERQALDRVEVFLKDECDIDLISARDDPAQES